MIETKLTIWAACQWLFGKRLILDYQGWQNIRPCPLCKHRRGLSVNVKSGTFKAHCCGKGGDVMALIMAARKCGFQEAVAYSEARREKGIYLDGQAYRF